MPGSGIWAIFDTEGLWRIVALSLGVSLSATALATLAGLSFGTALAVCSFPGRHALVILTNAFLGLPPVVVGLALYLLLSRSGPVGVQRPGPNARQFHWRDPDSRQSLREW